MARGKSRKGRRRPQTASQRRSSYFKGRGAGVYRSMRKRYGKNKGSRVFYATINKWISKGTPAQKRVQPKRRPGQKR